MRLPVNHALPLILITAVVGCGGGPAVQARPAPTQTPANGPAADYPVVLGAPFQIGDTTYTPEDKLNYDAVGYADVGADGGLDISAAHKTLPLPSYVEVTALDSGKTILVRVERRGPMRNDRLIELSPGAAAQLGLDEERAAVRVRRVNPPEQERAMLRAGGRAPERMETPRGLLEALNRKLAGGTASSPPAMPPRPAPVASPAAKPTPAPAPVSVPTPAAALKPPAAPPPAAASVPPKAPAPAPAPRAAERRALIVQVGAYSTEARAKASAERVGGSASRAGSLWRVRMGPFAGRGEAQAALAKARAAGYSDARIQRAD